MATRLLWMVVAPFEFAATVLVGVLLYFGGTLYFAACIYFRELSGLFERAAALAVQRFRVGRVFSSTNGKKTTPPVSEVLPRGPVGLGRFHSWLN